MGGFVLPKPSRNTCVTDQCQCRDSKERERERERKKKSRLLRLAIRSLTKRTIRDKCTWMITFEGGGKKE